MRSIYNILAVSALALAGLSANAQQSQADINKKVEALISKMTLEEKVGQMTQVTLDVLCKGKDRYSSTQPLTLEDTEMQKVFGKYHIGSVLNTAGGKAVTPQKWYELISGVQKASLTYDSKKVPVLYGVDEIHGATYTDGATMFPQEIAQGAARNPKLTERAAAITAYETRASNIPWTFGPVLDLGMDPRFPRQWETFGEDPYLCSVLGTAMINGYQGKDNNLAAYDKVASCMKHFLGYHAATSGKDRTPSYISAEALREYHLPAFRAAIQAGSQTVMINSGIINGVPVHANYDILTKLLKEELGFNGLVVTDWADIENLYKRDRMAASDKEAIMISINAGIDMSMVPYQYEVFCDNLIELVKEGKVTQARIDDAVRRILKVKYALNLFDKPNTNPKDYPKFGSKEHEKAAYDMAAEAITLLKNEGNVLPLKKNLKVLVTGPNANSMRTLNGGWTYTWQGDQTNEFAAKYNTILEAVQNEIGKANVTYIPGVSYKEGGHYYDELADKMDEAVAAAKNADVIILCLGENSYTEKPGDMNDLYLSDLQTELAKKLTATGKTVILVLNEGRPRVISKFEQEIKGIVQSYLPGNFGGDAIADVLFGDVNPSGKLPYTYPRYPNATISYIHKPSEEQKKAEGVYNYEADYNPQYQFGFGLSYTTFSYKDLTVGKPSVKKGEKVQVSVTVTNTGNVTGKEVVHLFTSDLYATSVTPDVKRLRRFEKIELKPGESKTVTFELDAKDLTYVGRDGKDILEAGDFEVMVDKLKAKFTLTE